MILLLAALAVAATATTAARAPTRAAVTAHSASCRPGLRPASRQLGPRLVAPAGAFAAGPPLLRLTLFAFALAIAFALRLALGLALRIALAVRFTVRLAVRVAVRLRALFALVRLRRVTSAVVA